MSMDVELDGIFLHNGTYDYKDYEYKEDEEPRGSGGVLYAVVYSLVFVVGLLCNGLLLAVLAQRRRSWSISDTFILHLSIADILLLLTLPLWATQAVHQTGWCFGCFLCKTSGVVFNINFCCGVLLLFCICVDRYRSIAHSTQVYTQKKPMLAHISCLLVWLSCLIFTIPDWISLVTTEESPKTLCQVHSLSQSKTGWLVSRLIHHMLSVLLLAAVLIIICSTVMLRLQRKSKDLQNLRSVKVILPLVVVFFVFWLPYIATLLTDTFRSSSKKVADSSDQSPEGSLKTILGVTFALGCVHACLRPLLYLGLCGSFRTQTLAMLRCAPAQTESLPSWELGVGEGTMPDQSHEAEELKQMKSDDHQVQC